MNYVALIIGAVAAFMLSFLLHTVDVDRIEKKQVAQLDALHLADTQQCNYDKSITKEANDAIRKDHDAIAARLNVLLQQPSTCVPVTSSPKLADSGQPKHAGQNGISSSWLRKYAAECEGYRSALITCESFTNNLKCE